MRVGCGRSVLCLIRCALARKPEENDGTAGSDEAAETPRFLPLPVEQEHFAGTSQHPSEVAEVLRALGVMRVV